jgi:hypothetical protein
MTHVVSGSAVWNSSGDDEIPLFQRDWATGERRMRAILDAAQRSAARNKRESKISLDTGAIMPY